MLYNHLNKYTIDFFNIMGVNIVSDGYKNDLYVNNYKYYHTIDDIRLMVDDDEYYNEILSKFNDVKLYNSDVFFKLYNNIRDVDMFIKLHNDMLTNTDKFINAYKSTEYISRYVINNKSVKSFLNYNLEFRKNVYKFDNKLYFNNIDDSFFNWKENYKTFRISNSFQNMSDSKIIDNIINIDDDEHIIELDIRSADLLFILFLNFLYNRNDKFKNISNKGVYDSVTVLDQYMDYSEKKKQLLILLYSIEYGKELTEIQKKVIKELDLVDFISYIISNKSICLPNGIYRTKKNNLAYYGQTLTSLMLRIIINSLMSDYNIILSKHDSIFIKTKKGVNINDLYIKIYGTYFNFNQEDYFIDEKFEKLFNIMFKKNIKIKQLK